MSEEQNLVEMIEPGTGRRCTVQEKDVAEFEARRYRRADQLHVPVGDAETATDDDLDTLTVAELRARLADAGLDASKAKKSELVDRLRNAPAPGADEADGSAEDDEGGDGE